MIITDIHGGKLSLTKTKLTEISGYSSEPYYLNLRHLKTLKSTQEVPIFQAEDGDGKPIMVLANATDRQIGCRTFSKYVFKKIMQAAKAAYSRGKK